MLEIQPVSAYYLLKTATINWPWHSRSEFRRSGPGHPVSQHGGPSLPLQQSNNTMTCSSNDINQPINQSINQSAPLKLRPNGTIQIYYYYYYYY